MFDTTATYNVTATVTYVDEELDPEVLPVTVVIAIPAAPTNSVAPTITGSPQVGVQTTVANGTWAGVPTPTFTYLWGTIENGNFVSGEITTQSFTPGGGWNGDTIVCRVTATNAHGSLTVQTASKTVAAP